MKKILIIGTWLCGISCLQAQVNIGGEPYSFNQSMLKSEIVEQMPPINRAQLDIEDEQDKLNNIPPRFGFPFEVQYNLSNSGQWDKAGDNARIWRLTIEAPNARSINLLYDDFWLPEDAKLYIYNEDKTHVIGGFTQRNNKGTREDLTAFATGLVKGDKITLEYYEPLEVQGQGQIGISRIVHGYRMTDPFQDLFLKLFGDSGSCQVNINCSEGNDYQSEKRTVAMTIVDGTRWCSGALLNAHGDELIPYFLTADHCLDGSAVNTSLDAITNPNGDDWVFYFNYESPNCADPTSDPISNASSFSGGRLLANDSDSDFALFRILEDTESSGGAVYAGWTTGDPGLGGAGIHHPSGDIQKISTHNMTPVSSDNDGFSPPNTHWRVLWSATANGFSVTEGGSSGSPLFDENRRIVGQLHGGGLGNPNCGNPAADDGFYGKFSTSWTGNGSSDRRRRLSDWIGPQCVSYQNITTTFTGQEPVIRVNTMDASNTVGSSAFVRYEASSWVDLEVGFDALPGSDFRASIGGDCAAARVDENGNAVYFTDTVSSDYTEILPESEQRDSRIEEEEEERPLEPAASERSQSSQTRSADKFDDTEPRKE